MAASQLMAISHLLLLFLKIFLITSVSRAASFITINEAIRSTLTTEIIIGKVHFHSFKLRIFSLIMLTNIVFKDEASLTSSVLDRLNQLEAENQRQNEKIDFLEFKVEKLQDITKHCEGKTFKFQGICVV